MLDDNCSTQNVLSNLHLGFLKVPVGKYLSIFCLVANACPKCTPAQAVCAQQTGLFWGTRGLQPPVMSAVLSLVRAALWPWQCQVQSGLPCESQEELLSWWVADLESWSWCSEGTLPIRWRSLLSLCSPSLRCSSRSDSWPLLWVLPRPCASHVHLTCDSVRVLGTQSRPTL